MHMLLRLLYFTNPPTLISLLPVLPDFQRHSLNILRLIALNPVLHLSVFTLDFDQRDYSSHT